MIGPLASAIRQETACLRGHIWVAMARGYADVSPLKDTYTGGAVSAIEVSVDVTRLA